jgi:uncharacterized membrane protein YccC
MLRSMGKSTVVMLACYGIGSLSAVFPTFHVPSLVILTALATLYCRTFNVGGPAGSMFFVIAACIGATSHTALTESLHKLMLVFTGCLWGIAVAVFYSRITRSRNTSSVIKVSITVLQKKIDQSVLIGVVVGGSLFVAQSIGLNNPYWVPISCLAVIQGSDFRDIWNKQLHRLVGTFLGVIWMSILFQSKPESDWEVAICIVLLSFAIELTVRHYATAVMFITPMTILLADVAQAHESSFWSLMQSRLLNTSIGCIAALYGGLCLHCFRSEDSP